MSENRSLMDRFMDPKTYQQGDLAIGVGVVVIIVMLVIPLPAFLLDFFIAINLLVSLLILLTVMYTKSAAEFSVFPSLLLITTLFRLAINVSSTRLILSEGSKFDGQIIRTFGDFVVAGNYVVGLIIFIVLIAVQFIVITKGASRVAEVAARFTLDALPGKQMGIDTDLQNGRITEEDAERKRKTLQKEVDFYGAMDGASKFVSGDVKVGIVITLINMIGGFIIGMVMHNEPFNIAMDTYIKLTIGDGLSSQIPSLLVTTATGIIVTRSISEQSLGKDLSQQLSAEPKALWVVAATLIFATLIPGFPKIPLLILGAGLGTLAFQLQRSRLESKQKQEQEERLRQDQIEKKPDDFSVIARVEPMEIEIGFSLIPLVDPKQGGSLLDGITSVRKRIATNAGLVVPAIRIRDNMELPSNTYSIKIRGVEYGRAHLEVGRLLAMDHGQVRQKVEGIETVDPAFQTPAVWIETERRQEAEKNGYVVVDTKTILLTHLESIITRNAALLLGRSEIRKMLDSMKKGDHEALIDDLTSHSSFKMGTLQHVLQNLLREQVSIKNLLTILETFVSALDYTDSVAQLTDYVRIALASQITSDLSQEGKLYVITVDPNIEKAMLNAVSEDPIEGKILAIDPETQRKLLDLFMREIQKSQTKGVQPAIVVSQALRSVVFDLLDREIGSVAVLSINEIAAGIQVEAVGRVTPKVA